VLWNQAVHTDREVTSNKPGIIIKNKKEKICTLIDVAIPADRNSVQKEAEKKLKYKSLCVEVQRMWNRKCTIIHSLVFSLDYSSNNWSHWDSNEKLKEKFGSCTRNTFDRFTTKDSYTWNIAHNTESTAV